MTYIVSSGALNSTLLTHSLGHFYWNGTLCVSHCNCSLNQKQTRVARIARYSSYFIVTRYSVFQQFRPLILYSYWPPVERLTGAHGTH